MTRRRAGDPDACAHCCHAIEAHPDLPGGYRHATSKRVRCNRGGAPTVATPGATGVAAPVPAAPVETLPLFDLA